MGVRQRRCRFYFRKSFRDISVLVAFLLSVTHLLFPHGSRLCGQLGGPLTSNRMQQGFAFPSSKPFLKFLLLFTMRCEVAQLAVQQVFFKKRFSRSHF
jgi:hypothetical protein